MRASDEAAFSELYVARRASLRRTAHLLCGDWHQADDLVQAAFVKVYLAWPRIRDIEAVDAYLRRTLVHLFVDETRLRRRHEQLFAEPPGAAGMVPNDPGDRLDLLAALQSVPKRQRACLVLRFYEDMSVTQTAEVMGCNEGTVKSQTARGLDALREVLMARDTRTNPTCGRQSR